MTEQECQNLLGWLVRREHLARKGIQLKVKNIQAGRALWGTKTITIPSLALGDQYRGTAYVIHEVAHFVNYYKGRNDNHGSAFKRIENRLLKLFGLSIKRKRAYAKALYYNGELI